jgi:exodeoxyribonuclease-3
MRIATYNINGVVARLDRLLAWLAETRPDAVCLQELKAEQQAFPEAALREAGYGAAWVGQRRWNGVAILARGTAPVVTRRALPGDAADGQAADGQARYIEAAVDGVLIGCLYAPNGNPQPGPKFDYKLAWNERLIAHAAGLLGAGVPAVLAGDYNVVPTAADIYNERSWKKNALLQPGPRAQFARLVASGWVDGLRRLHPGDPPPWTFWSVFRDSVARDAGMRIDHLLLSPAVVPRLRAAGVDRAMRLAAGASDHAPAWVELAAA